MKPRNLKSDLHQPIIIIQIMRGVFSKTSWTNCSQNRLSSAENFAILRSIIDTSIKNGQNVLAALNVIADHKRNWLVTYKEMDLFEKIGSKPMQY